MANQRGSGMRNRDRDPSPARPSTSRRSGQGGTKGRTTNRVGGGSTRPTGIYGALPRSVNNNLAGQNFDSGVTLPSVGGGNAGTFRPNTPGSSPTLSPSPAPSPSPSPSPSTGSTGRNDTRTNSKGVTQTGTNTGIKPMTLADIEGEGGLFARLGLAGTRVQDPYSSNQLPTTSSNPDSGPNEKAGHDSQTEGFLNSYTKGTTGGLGPVKSAQLADSAYTEGTSAVRPNESSGQSKPIRGAVDSRFDEGAEYGETYTSDLSNRARAFLDAEDSMTGLRAAEATQGIVYAGGQHNILNPNRGKEGENDFIGITNKDDVRGYKSGRLSAQDLLDKHMEEAKATVKETGDDSKGYKTITPDDPIAAKAFGQDWVDANKDKNTQQGYTTITPDNPIAAQAFGQDWVNANRGTSQRSKGFEMFNR